MDRKTVRKLLDRSLAAPAYSPREPRARLLEPYEGYLADKIGACPDLSGRQLFRETRELGYEGSYSAVTAYLRAIRPGRSPASRSTWMHHSRSVKREHPSFSAIEA